MTEVERRILDAVIKMVHVRKWRPKIIRLSPADYRQFRANRRTWRERNYIGGLEVRQGKTSRLFADHGYSGVSI